MIDNMPNYKDIRRAAADRLKKAGIDACAQEARIMIEAVSGQTLSDILLSDDLSVDEKSVMAVENMVARRLSGEPLDHILGSRSFYGREFIVTKDVLTPRPETELLVSAAISALAERESARVLDLGTGSGAIIISILLEAPHAEGIGADLSEAALKIAQDNAHKLGAADRLTLIWSNWFEDITGKFDLIVSNPPYIARGDLPGLMPEVRLYDPKVSLDGGEDGLDAYREILSRAPEFLRPDGQIIFEIGYDQARDVTELARAAGFERIAVDRDLSGHDRVIRLRSREM